MVSFTFPDGQPHRCDAFARAVMSKNCLDGQLSLVHMLIPETAPLWLLDPPPSGSDMVRSITRVARIGRAFLTTARTLSGPSEGNR